MKRLLCFFLVGILLLGVSAIAYAAKTSDELKAAATKALEDKGAVLTEVDVVYDEGNTMWEERAAYLETDTSINHGVLPHGILQGKTYQVIYFDFVETSPTEDTWVFLDPETGDVITVYEEK